MNELTKYERNQVAEILCLRANEIACFSSDYKSMRSMVQIHPGRSKNQLFIA